MWTALALEIHPELRRLRTLSGAETDGGIVSKPRNANAPWYRTKSAAVDLHCHYTKLNLLDQLTNRPTDRLTTGESATGKNRNAFRPIRWGNRTADQACDRLCAERLMRSEMFECSSLYRLRSSQTGISHHDNKPSYAWQAWHLFIWQRQTWIAELKNQLNKQQRWRTADFNVVPLMRASCYCIYAVCMQTLLCLELFFSG